MNYTLAVDINRKALLRIVAALFVVTKVIGDVMPDVLPRRVHLAVLEILRPAESAVRRLVAVLARDLTVPLRAGRAGMGGAIPKGTGQHVPAFPLFDPRKNVDLKAKRVPGNGPGVRGFYRDERLPSAPPAPMPDDPVNAKQLCRRLQALQNALDDLPKQAARLARILASGRAKFLRVMRPGRPPGYRARQRHAVDELLVDCHELALYALKPPDIA